VVQSSSPREFGFGRHFLPLDLEWLREVDAAMQQEIRRLNPKA